MSPERLGIALAAPVGPDAADPIPDWARHLARSLAEDQRGLRWAGFRSFDFAPPAGASSAASNGPDRGDTARRGPARGGPTRRASARHRRTGALAARILAAIDRPRFAHVSPLPILGRASSDAGHPEWPPIDPQHPATPVDVQVVFGVSDWPELSTLPAAHLQLCVLDQALPEQIDETLLARHSMLRLVLYACGDSGDIDALCRVGDLVGCPAHRPTPDTSAVAPWCRIDSHALPVQSFSRSDMLTASHGAIPHLLLSRLHKLAHRRAGIRERNDHPTASAGAGAVTGAVTGAMTRAVAHERRPGLRPAEPFDADPLANPRVNPNRSSGSTRLALQLYGRWLAQRLRHQVRDEQWQLRMHWHDPNPDRMDRPLHRYVSLAPPPDTMWADPHLLERDGEVFVFMEALAFQENRGRIAMARLGPNGLQSPPVDVLDEPYHLSYPFVFEHDGHPWMVPETATRREVSLYRAHAFPFDWRQERILLHDTDLADCTLHDHEGRWWLFANGISHPAVDERDLLYLFYTDDFRHGQWTPHPMNPVVTGVDRSRMAGALFTHDGALYRPCQFGARRYGFGFNLARIDVLSPTDYQESLVTRLTPLAEPNLLGVHTYSRGRSVTLIDVLQARWRTRRAPR